jgi:hypothetical protein
VLTSFETFQTVLETEKLEKKRSPYKLLSSDWYSVLRLGQDRLFRVWRMRQRLVFHDGWFQLVERKGHNRDLINFAVWSAVGKPEVLKR